MVSEQQAREMVRTLGITLPEIGSQWWWEPTLPHAASLLVVTDVQWNGEEWWISARAADDADSKHYPNDWWRWMEATVMHVPAEDGQP